MNKKSYDTIIIGAGISGLSCARRLSSNNSDFLIISKDIGGRLTTSEDGSANYGAFFVCSDYKNFLEYCTLKNRIRLRDFCFHEKGKKYVLFQTKLIPYIFQFIKIYILLFKFRKRLRKLRIVSEKKSQKKAIKEDKFLYLLYNKSAEDFVKDKGLMKGTNVYLSKALFSTTFSEISEMNAFSYLQFLIPLVTPVYRFKFDFDSLSSSFKDKIIIDIVKNIKYNGNQYEIILENKSFFCKNLVLATEITWSKKYTDIKEVNKKTSTNMLHIKGFYKDNFKNKRYHLFSPGSEVQAIADLEDGTYLFYYKEKRPNLNKYFENSKILHHRLWDPAGTINGHNLIECIRKNNLYIIGDCNIAGLEEAYITGLYCANMILSSP